VEDNGRAGGFGDAVCRLLRDADVDTPCKTFGLPQEFLNHASRDSILEATGLNAQHLARQLTEAVVRLAQSDRAGATGGESAEDADAALRDGSPE
jgi:1-deoxy-D-xylulose-5-phosphate synthase